MNMRADYLVKKVEKLLMEIQLEQERLAALPRVALYDPAQSDIEAGEYVYLPGHEPRPGAAYVVRLPSNGR